jgi:hypothetical protein
MMKKCTKCGVIKPFNDFHKRSSVPDGLASNCKLCVKYISSRFKESKHGLLSTIYYQQVSSSKHRCHERPNYSREEFMMWAHENESFEHMYMDWVNSGYKTKLRPSADRLNNSKGYSLDNIQLVTWGENKKLAYKMIREGIIKHRQKRVQGTDIDTDIPTEYSSVSEAYRQTGVHQSNISRCCSGELKRAGNYTWKFISK